MIKKVLEYIKRIDIMKIAFQCTGYGIGSLGVISSIITTQPIHIFIIFLGMIILTYVSTKPKIELRNAYVTKKNQISKNYLNISYRDNH
jgi:hypothetical protein